MSRKLATILITGQVVLNLAILSYIWINQHWANKMTAIVEKLLSNSIS